MIKPAFLAFNFKEEADRLAVIDIFQQCQCVLQKRKLERFSIIVNGGDYQDVPQVHFHIAFDDKAEEVGLRVDLDEPSFPFTAVTCFRPASSPWTYHRVLQHQQIKTSFLETNFDDFAVQTAVIDLLEAVQQTIIKGQMDAFSVMIKENVLGQAPLSMEIVSNHLKSC